MLEYNYSNGDPRGHQWEHWEQTMKIFTRVVYGLVFVLGTTGNGLVIFITGFRMKKTVNTVWILNLAIADFTFSFLLPWNGVGNKLELDQPLDQIKCELKHILIYFNLFASVYTLTVISVDRCIAVWCPVWARNHRTPRLASFVVLGVWILALVLSSLKLHLTKSTYGCRNETRKYCLSYDDFHSAKEAHISCQWVTLRFVFGFIIPFIVIVVCYGAVAWRIRRYQLSYSRKPFKIITAVIVAFFVCWFPLHFFLIFHFQARVNKTELKQTLLVAFPVVSSLAFFNSCLNPILYFCLGYNFKGKWRCSLLFDFLNVFTEESNHSNPKVTAGPSAELESQGL